MRGEVGRRETAESGESSEREAGKLERSEERGRGSEGVRERGARG